jgi:hypothetical protein
MKEQESNIIRFTSIDYCIYGVSVLKYPQRDLLMLHKNKIKTNFEKARRIISHIPKGFTVAVADESLHLHT